MNLEYLEYTPGNHTIDRMHADIVGTSGVGRNNVDAEASLLEHVTSSQGFPCTQGLGFRV